VSRKCLRPRDWRSRCAGGRARWRIDVDAWRPPLKDGGAEWSLLLSLVAEPEERGRVLKFAHWIDRARALVSRLAVRRAAALCLGLDPADVAIERTKGRKPYLAARSKAAAAARADAPNFNFNVSHDGKYVVLAAEPKCLVGVDVAAPESARMDMRPAAAAARSTPPPRRRPSASAADLGQLDAVDLGRMRDCLSAAEWAWLHEGGPAAARGERFRRLWAGKEAFTKARGDGLGFSFGAVHLDVADVADPARSGRRRFDATVTVGGTALADWRVHGEVLDGGHVVAVARGPPADAQDAFGLFAATLTAKRVDAAALDACADEEWVSLDPRDLVPDGRRPAYDAAVAADRAAHGAAKTSGLRAFKSTGDMRTMGRVAPSTPSPASSEDLSGLPPRRPSLGGLGTVGRSA